MTAPVPFDARARSAAQDLADGQWHRLHPATPLLRGGIAFVAIAAFVLSNLRERLVELVFGVDDGGQGDAGDPIELLVRRGLVPIALLVVLAVLVVIILIFWLSWRVHTFRITDEVVEVRSGILFRTNRKCRLDPIQGINIQRPLFARIFGAAKLDVNVAGQDGNVQLAYLSGRNADALRLVILRLASGSRERSTAAQPAPAVAGGGIIGQRIQEFAAPELDPALAPPTAVVTMHPGRLIGSTVLSTAAVWFVLVVAAAIVAVSLSHAFYVIFALIPAVLGLGSYLINRVVKSLRYSIAATPDGVRVGFGLLSLSNETLPPGRIHSVEISQPLLWRPADWWEVRINLAGQSTQRGADGRRNTTILPVGTRAEVLRVLELMLPGLVDGETQRLIAAGLERAAPGDGYTTSPRRAAVIRWFSWRRNGFALRPEAVLLRRGAVWRDLIVVPMARMQSVAVHQGPLLRMLRLATVFVHTVAGPIQPRLGGIDAATASRLFHDVAQAGVAAAVADRSHRWRADAPVLAPPRASERRADQAPA